jgi:hypothetical protein
MIERHSGKQQLVCACGASHKVYAADDFTIMITEAKADGWKVHKVAGEWEHCCSDCVAPSRRKGTLL